jgi:hypothetical protein
MVAWGEVVKTTENKIHWHRFNQRFMERIFDVGGGGGRGWSRSSPGYISVGFTNAKAKYTFHTVHVGVA